MFKVILLSSTLLLGSISLASADHTKASKVQLAEGDGQSKPEAMRSTSVRLLETPIGITKDYGEGNFFLEESTKVQKLVNQGFAMLNTFQWVGAFRSFNTAINLEPKSVEAHIGRAFSSISLDPGQSYYLNITKSFLEKNRGVLSKEQKAWANFLLAVMIQKDIEGKALSTAHAFTSLQKQDPNNIEVSVFGNWVSNTYNVALLEVVIKKDSENAGATHYLLHLAEMKNDHDTAVFYGERLSKLALGSGHGQHMYGHVLPHFNRWNEADHQFTLAHNIHLDWAKKNGVHPSEDWHYSHNLNLWSVTSMVLNPSKAVEILEELEPFHYSYSLDLLDLRIVIGTNDKVEDGVISGYEVRSEGWRNAVASSRKLHTLINQSDKFEQIKVEILNNLNWKESSKDNTLYISLVLIDANKRGDVQTQKKVIDHITSTLSNEFYRGGFDGWRKSVLEVLVYSKIFEVYRLDEAAKALKEKVIDVHMSPID